MTRIVTIIALCIGCLLTANAQTFTQRIQQKGSRVGEGTVTVTHSKTIDDLVNGSSRQVTPTSQTAQPQRTQASQALQASQASQPSQSSQKPQQPASDAEKARQELRRIMDDTPDTTATGTFIDTRRKVMRGGIKINGYRVQAFAGGNQRKDRQKAEKIGNTIKASYPEEPIYVHFYSPRWICRVGNYRTYEEAHQMLLNIRKLGISGASVVKGKITVQY